MASPEDNRVYVCNGGGWQSVSSGWHKCWYVKARACVCLFVCRNAWSYSISKCVSMCV